MSKDKDVLCERCGATMSDVYAYSTQIAYVIGFAAFDKNTNKWQDVGLWMCPKCGHIQGEVCK